MDKNIIRMANDIANNWQVFGDDEPIAMIAEHINKFWSPPMREKLIRLIESNPYEFNRLVVDSKPNIRHTVLNPITGEFKDKSGTGG